jgi:uncharacterized protein (DUF1778 family)
MKKSGSFLTTNASKETRFDTRLSIQQKMLFTEAASIMGFKSLSEFVIQTTQSAAHQIIEKNKITLSTDKDREKFFKALSNPPKPNKTLMDGAKRYKEKFLK